MAKVLLGIPSGGSVKSKTMMTIISVLSMTQHRINVALQLDDAASVGNQTFRNNAIYTPGLTSVVQYKSTGITTVGGFQSACSGDVCAGNLASDPQIVRDNDFRLGATSPLRRAGIWTTNGCKDVRGRPCWVPPDIGAYQSSSGDPAGTRLTR